MKSIVYIFIVLISFSFNLFAQEIGKVEELTEKEKSEVVDSISKLLRANYIFPEVADKMTTLINTNLKKGKYQSIIDCQVYADKLTQDLQSVSNDKHLKVVCARQYKSNVTPEDSLKSINNHIERLRRDNFGFKEVKILDGNIGYLDLRMFSDTKFAGETAVAAMNFLSNADALIVDLRNNGGGSPSMIQLITSYFYSAEPVHLNNFYWRPSDVNNQTWTLPYVPGKRRPDIDLYVLTSSSTFSAAEEFSYNLKNMKRATLIGETTGGGAHPGGMRIATERFMVWVPSGRAINPITKTNWEGTGVEPHIKTTKEEALYTARITSLEKLKKQCKEENRKKYYDWYISALNYSKNVFEFELQKLSQYVGKFGPLNVTMEGGKLYCRQGGQKLELITMTTDLFGVVDLPNCRIQFVKQNNAVSALKMLFDNGDEDEFKLEIQVSNNSAKKYVGDTVTDIVGNLYHTVVIGSQTWMVEDLKTTRYRNGDPIDTTALIQLKPGDEVAPKYQWADSDDDGNIAAYGRLYTWYAITDNRNVCPTGWHVPADEEWTTLVNFLGGAGIAGGKLKEAGPSRWKSPNAGATNESGFSALPTGNHYKEYNIPIGDLVHYWTATESLENKDCAWRWLLSTRNNLAHRGYCPKVCGWAVRCIKD